MKAGSHLILWLRDGSTCRVHPRHEDEVERALDRLIGKSDTPWADGEDGDTLLRMADVAGQRIRLRASYITGFHLSTPEGRAASDEHDVQLAAEAKARKAALAQVGAG